MAIEKPKMQVRKYWDWHDIQYYIEMKYDISFHDYAGRDKYHNECIKEADKICGDNSWYTTAFKDHTYNQQQAHEKYKEMKKLEPPRQDFWGHILDRSEIHNGCFICLSFEDLEDEEIDEEWCPYWAKEILAMIKNEFSENGKEIDCYVSW
jgi:hypothetical protein